MTAASLRARASVLGLALLLAVAVGCSGGAKHVPVSGKVFIGNDPASPAGEGWSGTVKYVPDEEKGMKPSTTDLIGEIKEGGAYSMVGVGGKAGIPAGWYKVAVDIKKPSNPKDPYSMPVQLINQRFKDASTSGLQIEVKPDAPEGHYDIKVTK